MIEPEKEKVRAKILKEIEDFKVKLKMYILYSIALVNNLKLLTPKDYKN